MTTVVAEATILVLLCVGVVAGGCRAKTSTADAKSEKKTPATEEMELPEGEEDIDISEGTEDLGDDADF
ncbi:MAG: hypothetical protein ISS31_06665 [Kiritimatiellae bacterium]|nr:hypothetical protein [Kiritimatiellia bacterium]